MKFISDITPQIIYDKSIEKGNGSFIEHNTFKLNIIKKEKEKDKKSSTNYKLEYTIGEDSYEISFSVKENTFVYEPELKKGNKYIDNIVKESIDQDIILLQDKLDIFLEALEKNNETNKKEKLYEETITLYEKKKKFSLLISLFLKIYEENKSLCSKLLDTFKKINEKENTDIYLNEIYIIDELIKIIEYELDKGIKSIENIEDIRENLVENSKIIQKIGLIK